MTDDYAVIIENRAQCPECRFIGGHSAFCSQHISDPGPAIGDTRACLDCGRPQHYTGTEYGWAHDALVDTWHCADPRKADA